MAWWNPYTWGWGLGGAPAPVEVPAPITITLPTVGEQTGRQDAAITDPRLWGVAGCLGVGYEPAPPGTLATYRLMDSHPTLSLARAVVCGPLIAAQPTFEGRTEGGSPRRTPAVGDGVQNDPRVDFIKSVFEPLWPDLIEDCCRGLSLGHYPFEQVWSRKGGRWVVERFKPLLPERAVLLVDPKGNFAGVRTQRPDNQSFDLAPLQCFNYVYDGEAGYLYGRSRHENCRAEWWEKLQAKIKAATIDHKASGIIPIIKAPAKLSFKNEQGKDISGIEAARIIGGLLAQGRPVTLQNQLWDVSQLSKKPTAEEAKGYAELAKVSAFVIDFFDAGNTGPASAAILDKLRYLDSELFRAWHRPEREALEGQQGTKAESAVQGQVGVQDTERTMAGMYRQISGGCIDDVLAANFGEEARGSVYAKAPPLRDVKKEAAASAAEKIITTPEAQAVLDVPQTLKDASLPVLDKPKPVERLAPVGAPGNGRLNGNGQAAALSRLVGMLGEDD
jgi:hypothetical protein